MTGVAPKSKIEIIFENHKNIKVVLRNQTKAQQQAACQ